MRVAIAIGAAAGPVACADGDQRRAGTPDKKVSHLRIGHLMTSCQDTPDQIGLAPTQHMQLMQEGEGMA